MSQQQLQAVQQLVSMGWSPVQAAGIVGNLVQESGPGLNTRAVHDKGTGYGIAGWRDPAPGQGRKTALFNFAQGNGADVNDLGTQLRFLNSELNGSERGVGDALRAAKTPEEAARAFIGYERPQGWSADNPAAGHGYANRVNNAVSIAGMFGNGPVQPAPTIAAGQPDPDARAVAQAPVQQPPALPKAQGVDLAAMFAPDPFGAAMQGASDYLAAQQKSQQQSAAERQRRMALYGMG